MQMIFGYNHSSMLKEFKAIYFHHKWKMNYFPDELIQTEQFHHLFYPAYFF